MVVWEFLKNRDAISSYLAACMGIDQKLYHVFDMIDPPVPAIEANQRLLTTILRAPRRVDDELEPLSYVEPHVPVSTTILVVIAGTRVIAVAFRHGTHITMDNVATPALVAVLKACETVAFHLTGDQALLDGGAADVPIHSVMVQCSDVIFRVTIDSCYKSEIRSGICDETDDQQWLSTMVHSRDDAVLCLTSD